jgi:hypothetical protein
MKRPEFLSKEISVITTTTLHALKKASAHQSIFMKNLLLLVVTLSVSSCILAQKNVTFGVKGGLNVSTLNYKDIDDSNDPRISFHAGALAHIHLNDKWAIQPEALASKEGFNDNTSSQKWRILYLNLPVMVQYMFAKGFRLEAGPEFGFRLGAQVSNGGEFVNATSAYNQLNFSAAGGVSYLSKYNIGITARYTKGLTDITQGTFNYVSTDVIQLGLFYHFKNLHWKSRSHT